MMYFTGGPIGLFDAKGVSISAITEAKHLVDIVGVKSSTNAIADMRLVRKPRRGPSKTYNEEDWIKTRYADGVPIGLNDTLGVHDYKGTGDSSAAPGELAFAGADFAGTAGNSVTGMIEHTGFSAKYSSDVFAGNGPTSLHLTATAFVGGTAQNYLTTSVNLNNPGSKTKLTFYIKGNYTASDGSGLVLLFSIGNAPGVTAPVVLINGAATAYHLSSAFAWGSNHTLNYPSWTKIMVNIESGLGATGDKTVFASNPMKIRGRNNTTDMSLFFDEFRYED
jgi:hypothetical protein